MKRLYFILPLLCIGMAVAAQDNHTPQTAGNHPHHTDGHQTDSSDVFFRHLKLNELVVTGVTGDTKLKHSTAPISIVSGKELRQTTSTNIIDAVAKQPGVSQITTGGGISKPIIRGLGYNRIIVMNDGVRQEGQQWGDEHGIEVDGASIGSVEILKGPASLMYGSDAMAGVLILHSAPVLPEGEMWANVSTEYQTNNGLFDYSLNMAGHQKGFVWDGRYSQKMSHQYKNKTDGYVAGSQFSERAGRLMLGVQQTWGHSRLTLSAFHQTPSIIEGEDEANGGKTYSKTLPFQQIYHYKAIWDNSLNLKNGWLKAIIGYQQNRRQEYEESPDEYELFFRLHTVTYDVRYLSQELGDGWKLAGGVNGMWQQSQNLGEETLIPAYKLFDIGGYATVSKSLERLTLNGGLRYDHRHLDSDGLYHFSNGLTRTNTDSQESPNQSVSVRCKNYTAASGSIGAVWNATERLNLRLNLARGFRAPNMSELGSDGVHEGTLRYEIGNPDLKPEYSWQGDLGLDFASQYVSAQVALFANRIESYIFAMRVDHDHGVGSPDQLRTYEYTQGDARLLGFEAGIDLHPIHSLHFENTFSFVDARQLHVDADTKYLPMTPAPRWTSELKYEITHHGHMTANTPHHSHKAPFNNAYVALRLETNLAQNHYYRADDTETRTPGYTLLSLSAGADLNIRGRKMAELYVTADNLLNRAYQNHLSRLKYIGADEGGQGYCNMGRNVVLKAVIPIAL